MLSRSQRLSVEQFNSVMEKGRVSHSSLFLMRATSGMTDTRIASVAPKKAAKTAAERNKIRRKIYGAVRTIKDTIKPGTHAIIFAKPTLTEAASVDVIVDLKTLFVKAGLLV